MSGHENLSVSPLRKMSAHTDLSPSRYRRRMNWRAGLLGVVTLAMVCMCGVVSPATGKNGHNLDLGVRPLRLCRGAERKLASRRHSLVASTLRQSIEAHAHRPRRRLGVSPVVAEAGRNRAVLPRLRRSAQLMRSACGDATHDLWARLDDEHRGHDRHVVEHSKASLSGRNRPGVALGPRRVISPMGGKSLCWQHKHTSGAWSRLRSPGRRLGTTSRRPIETSPQS
jgi:hypothetical protein